MSVSNQSFLGMTTQMCSLLRSSSSKYCKIPTKEQGRTISQVILLQSTMVGCCDEYVNRQGCDCLQKAIPEEKGDAWEPGGVNE